MREGYSSRSVCVYMCVCVCVCVSVCYHANCYIPRLYIESKVLYDVFKVFVVRISLKTLRSKVLVSFADHHCLPRSLTGS